MNGLNCENINRTGYDPREKLRAFSEKYRENYDFLNFLFLEIDPLHVNYGANPDEYCGYTERAFNSIQKKLEHSKKEISEEEIFECIKSAFSDNQLSNEHLKIDDLKKIARDLHSIL